MWLRSVAVRVMVWPVRRLVVLAALAFALLLAGGLSSVGQAAPGEAPDVAPALFENLDARIDGFVAPVADRLSAVIFYAVPVGEAQVRLIVVWLVLAALVFTVYFRFINFRGFGHALSLVRGRHAEPGQAGEVTHFQALTAALSGTVGLGNIAGVAAAIALGGPGATFWMIVAALFGMATKFVEASLGAKFRLVHKDGSISGGPMYYLSRGLAEINFPRLGKVLAAFFAISCVGGAIGAGNMFQANQAYRQFVNASAIVLDSMGAEADAFASLGWLFGLVLAALVGLVLLGGIKGIVRVTEKIVPFMGGFYVLSALVILVINFERLPAALTAIIVGAFTPDAGYGGLIGVLVWGFQRATFSNEAGIGSAPIAYSSVRTAEPLSVGFVSLLEPFIDTVIICTMTALVIVVSGAYLDGEGIQGVELTSRAFATAFDWFPLLLAVAVILFAFSTIITWSYYGLKSWTYLFGETKTSETLYKLVFLGFTVIGAAMALDKVIAFSDAMIFAMAFPNVIGMYLLAGGIKRDLAVYMRRLREAERVPRPEAEPGE
jgi:AGCS family alanine or glycine:cation symporter